MALHQSREHQARGPVADAPLSVLLAGLDELTCAGLNWLLARDERFRVIGDAAADPGALVHALSPALVVLNPVADGRFDLDLIAELQRAAAATRVAVLTDHFDPASYLDAIHAGIHGYFFPEYAALGAPFLHALEGIGRYGHRISDPMVGARFRAAMEHIQVHDTAAQSGHLTTRQQEVLALLCLEGRDDKTIAASLRISPSTVEDHIARVQQLLGSTNRGQLGWRLRDRGLLLHPPHV